MSVILTCADITKCLAIGTSINTVIIKSAWVGTLTSGVINAAWPAACLCSYRTASAATVSSSTIAAAEKSAAAITEPIAAAT